MIELMARHRIASAYYRYDLRADLSYAWTVGIKYWLIKVKDGFRDPRYETPRRRQRLVRD